ncbi:probable G patch domain-containing protein 11 [Coccomyxa sp. Obi]|nr:probable G patch domain-containing protein 11 [Coccomyxa sp. Obi]
MHGTGKKLWLPPQATVLDPDRDKRREAPVEEGSSQAEEEDDLDKLLEQYERQAEADKAKVLSAKEEKSLAQMGMAELRENALAKPLSAQTKGFQLLAKMGYKEGEGIGKSVKGRVAPIAVDLKSGRTGLGVDEGRKRQREAAKLVKEAQDAKRRRGIEDLRSDYITKQAASFADRQAERHLAQARKVCETLDRRKGITENVMWPVEPVSDGDEKEDEVKEGSWESLPAAGKLSDVLTCLRMRHFYCLFCGCQYESRDAMEESCPGATEDVH